MLGYATESGDFNLPVDAITRKPTFSFSCNRRIRETYNGPLLKTVDGDVYPADLESSKDKKVTKIYDQKIKHNCPSFDLLATGDIFLRKKTGPYYYIEATAGAYFEFPATSFFTNDAGVLVVCDPTDINGRAPVFSVSNANNELCFDVGSAYMRFNHYKISERHQLFGGIDSPDQEYNSYLGNFSEKTTIRNASGFSGVSLRKDPIDSDFTDGFIGRDASGNTFTGQIYELIITNFEIPNDSVNEAFEDMSEFYSLT